jgi:hypothetical protein
MPKELMRVRLRRDGVVVLAEVDPDQAVWEADDAFVRAADRGEPIAHAADSIEGALDSVIVPTAEAVMERLRKLSPSHVQLEFGLVMSGKVGLVFASSEAEAHLTVALSWDQKADSTK